GGADHGTGSSFVYVF
nr:immunoglobulin light chain junction region [Macaca mulatta]